jgi:hypothetical protein
MVCIICQQDQSYILKRMLNSLPDNHSMIWVVPDDQQVSPFTTLTDGNRISRLWHYR